MKVTRTQEQNKHSVCSPPRVPEVTLGRSRCVGSQPHHSLRALLSVLAPVLPGRMPHYPHSGPLPHLSALGSPCSRRGCLWGPPLLSLARDCISGRLLTATLGLVLSLSWADCRWPWLCSGPEPSSLSSRLCIISCHLLSVGSVWGLAASGIEAVGSILTRATSPQARSSLRPVPGSLAQVLSRPPSLVFP